MLNPCSRKELGHSRNRKKASVDGVKMGSQGAEEVSSVSFYFFNHGKTDIT